AITGGVAGNVIPDRCVVTVNYRFAPDRDAAGAERHLREVFGRWDVAIVDAAPSARPGLSDGPATLFAAAVGGAPRAKLGWTDVARFAELGIPAVNYGPGISELSHTPDEYVEIPRIGDCEARLRRWLSAP
ncbi:MAG TPA: peptidase dimerization domain-containing protein, partial [Streptosporangiaceae bacterium]